MQKPTIKRLDKYYDVTTGLLDNVIYYYELSWAQENFIRNLLDKWGTKLSSIKLHDTATLSLLRRVIRTKEYTDDDRATLQRIRNWYLVNVLDKSKTN